MLFVRESVSPEDVAVGSRQFVTTHWSVVVAARDNPSQQADEALEQLCSVYWYPLYSYVRRRGFNPADAQDLTQEFFFRLLDRKYLEAADYRKGRFRTFLLTALEHFLANEWRRSRALKRGGQITFQSIDEQSAEERYAREPASWLSPDKVYDQNCALALLDRALKRLRMELVAEGKGQKFEQLKVFMTADAESPPYAKLAAEMNTTVAALKMAVSRMRTRYGQLLREELANTVSSPEAVEEELCALLESLSY
jgi:RNA polymerase sigma-70 factor (ECF subfamily)